MSDTAEQNSLSSAVAEGVSKALEGYKKQGTERVSPESISIQVVVVYPPADFRTFATLIIVIVLPVGLLVFSLGGAVEKHIPAIIGLVLVAASVALAFAFRDVTPVQRQILLALFALAGGAIATEIPGFLNIDVSLGEKTAIGAGGALAVFVLLYLFSARKPPD